MQKETIKFYHHLSSPEMSAESVRVCRVRVSSSSLPVSQLKDQKKKTTTHCYKGSKRNLIEKLMQTKYHHQPLQRIDGLMLRFGSGVNVTSRSIKERTTMILSIPAKGWSCVLFWEIVPKGMPRLSSSTGRWSNKKPYLNRSICCYPVVGLKATDIFFADHTI